MNKNLSGECIMKHISGIDLEKIIKEIKENENNYAPMDLNIEKINKLARYTIEIEEGYIDTITVTESKNK